MDSGKFRVEKGWDLGETVYGGEVKDLKSKLLYSFLIHYIHCIISLHILPIF